MNLFYDTETTGMLCKGAPAGDPRQPHIVQLGAQLCDEDKRIVGEMNLLVKPDRWSIPPEATAIHGITTEMCERYGLPIATVIKMFGTLVRRAKLRVAHNNPYDEMMVWSELVRIQDANGIPAFLELPSFCTMQASTPILKLPGKYGDFKWPNLQEAHKHFLGSNFDGAHDAMEDVRACKRVYYAIVAQAAPPSPAPESPPEPELPPE